MWRVTKVLTLKFRVLLASQAKTSDAAESF